MPSPVRGMIGEHVMCPSVGSECSVRAPMEKIESAGIPNSALLTPFCCSAIKGRATASPPLKLAPGITDAFLLVNSHWAFTTSAAP